MGVWEAAARVAGVAECLKNRQFVKKRVAENTPQGVLGPRGYVNSGGLGACVRHLLADGLQPGQDGGRVPTFKHLGQVAFDKAVLADVGGEQLA
jgi:hypothetical protein